MLRTTKSRGLPALLVLLLVALMTPLGVGAALADEDDSPDSGDPRATAFSGNATTCNEAGLSGKDVTARVTVTDDGTYADVSGVPSNVTITGVVVKGGNGYNVYTDARTDLHAPLNASDKPAGISHLFVCGEVAAAEEPQPEPSGTLTGDCDDSAFRVKGSLDSDGGANVSFRLLLSTGATVALSGTSFDEKITAAAGTTVTLQAKVGDGDWTKIDGPVTVKDCTPVEEEQPEPNGSLQGSCDIDGDFVVTGELDADGAENAQFQLSLSTGEVIELQGTSFEELIGAAAGTKVTLQVRVGSGEWVDADESVTVKECAGEGANPQKVTLCHRTNAETNPYVQITVSVNAVVRKGHGDHTGPIYRPGLKDAKTKWGDIIPPFTYTDNKTGEVRTYPGMNYTPEGRALLEDDCVFEKTETPQEKVGSVEIKKVMDGEVAGALTTFTVMLDCDGNTYDKSYVLAAGNDWAVKVEGIVAGTTCEVTEPTVPVGWTLTSISPDGMFTVVADESVKVTVTNTRVVEEQQVGSVEIKKVVVGDMTGTAGAFEVELDCTGDAYDKTIVLNAGNSFTATTGDIAAGTECSVTEPNVPAGYTLTSISPSGTFTVVADESVKVTVTNTRVVGESPQRGLGIVKAVTPAGSASFGDTLTYSLTVLATGNAAQTEVTVTDAIPAGTTYVNGSAACDTGTCNVTVANGVVTWGLGTLTAGTSRTVTFAVTINTPAAAADGSIPAVTIVNAGAVSSAQVGTTPSDEVVTPVAAVAGVKIGDTAGGSTAPGGNQGGGGSGPGQGSQVEAENNAPTTVTAVRGVKAGVGALAATGASLPLPVAIGGAVLMLLAGAALVKVGLTRP